MKARSPSLLPHFHNGAGGGAELRLAIIGQRPQDKNMDTKGWRKTRKEIGHTTAVLP